MSRFLCKTILFGSFNVKALAQTSLSTYCCSLRRFSSSCSNKTQSFTVSYLTNTLGFSPMAAISASRHVEFDYIEKPDKAIEFLKVYGFSLTQISSIVRKYPQILKCDAEKILLPKLEFLRNKGISVPDLARKLSLCPGLLKCSLDYKIIPTYEFFRSLLKSDERTIKAFLRYPEILTLDIKNGAVPNITLLQEHGVPNSYIATLITRNPTVIVSDRKLFQKIVEEVVAMGFDPALMSFVVAVAVIRKVGKTKWESKVNVLKKWGWSEELVMEAFRRQPLCRAVSEDKISAFIDFFTNQTCWTPFDIAKDPLVLSMSLKKRVIPRCLVYQHLQSKGLVKKEISLSALFNTSNERFRQKFVTCYEKETPELLKLFEQKFLSFKQSEEQSSTKVML